MQGVATASGGDDITCCTTAWFNPVVSYVVPSPHLHAQRMLSNPQQGTLVQLI